MTKTKHEPRPPRLDSADVLAILGVAILAASIGWIYPPAGGAVVGLYLLAVANRKD
jgi:hypothetical protein